MNAQRILKVVVVAELLGIASTSYAAKGTWTRKADMPTARICSYTGVVDSKIYAIGGGRNITGGYLSTVEMYDPTTDTWTRKTNMPTARNGHAVSAVNGKIYAIGGEPSAQASISTVEEYDPTTDTWTQKADMPTRRTFLCAAAVNGKIYAIGGVIAGEPADPDWDTRHVEEYDPTTDTWTRKADMLTARSNAAACAVDGKIYVIGGVTGNLHNAPVSTVEEYAPATDTWTRKANMPTARTALSASVVDGKIYAIGGGIWNGSIFSKMEKYDPATDTWTTESDMNTRRIMFSTSVVNGIIYAIGGTQQWYPCPGISIVEEYELNPFVVDFNGDGIVDGEDVCMMVEYWHTDETFYDIAPPPFGDGIVDVQDLILLSEHLFEEILPDELIEYWTLDETEGDIAYNSTSYNYGILSGNPTWQPDSGRVGGALEFDGIDDYISADFVLDPSSGSFSAFVWVKGGSSGEVIISQTDGVGVPIGTGNTWLGLDGQEGTLMTGLVPPSAGWVAKKPLVSESIISDDQWHHIGFVWDNSYRILYADGIEVARDTIAQNPLKPATGGLHIGAGKSLHTGTFFSGLIDDVRIYEKALTAEEIAALAQ